MTDITAATTAIVSISTAGRSTAHTAGPWHIEADRIWQEGDNPWPIAYLGEGAKRDANARLIAAAPDLLAALESLLASDLIEWFPPSPNTGGLGDWTDALKAKGAPVLAARAAIAKAKGA